MARDDQTTVSNVKEKNVGKQGYSHAQIISGVKKIIAAEFKTKDLLELKRWITGVIHVAQQQEDSTNV